jgi:hypothetical protein
MPFLMFRIREVDIGFDYMQIAEGIAFQFFRQMFDGFRTANTGRNLQNGFGFRTDYLYWKYPYQPVLSEICDDPYPPIPDQYAPGLRACWHRYAEKD